MKSKKNLLEQLETLPHFGKVAILQLGRQLGLTDASVNTYISRFLSYKEIIRLKNGLYVTTNFFDKNKNDISYTFYLANILRAPSYVSSWSALQYYDLATEAVHGITSVTVKVTKDYQTKAGTFTYQSIKKDLFSGFSLIHGLPDSKAGKFDFAIASPSKALFDVLYFRTNQLKNMTGEQIMHLIEDLRIDFDDLIKAEREKFNTLIKKHFNE